MQDAIGQILLYEPRDYNLLENLLQAFGIARRLQHEKEIQRG